MIYTKIITVFLFLLVIKVDLYTQKINDISSVNKLFNDIYYLRIETNKSKPLIKEVHAFLQQYCSKIDLKKIDKSIWVFPVKNYSAKAIGGTKGEGYRGASSYNFFSGNSHGGHPAHDIFIADHDFNCLDDKTGKPVNVLSVSGGVVICTNPTWSIESLDSKNIQSIRGGIYTWIYDPITDGLFYYAHLKKVTCSVGQIVKPGDTIGEVGRTGKNALPKRSPTHLHFMYLSFKNGFPVPYDIYTDLVRIGCKIK